VLSTAYGTTLSALAPANFFLVVGAALLSLVAGASILVDFQFLTKLQSGVLALASGALTIVHSKLGCEPFQAECRKLRSFYRGKAEDYRNLAVVTDIDDFRKRLLALNDQLAVAARNASALPFDWAKARAQMPPA
jgi:hypothetical protein